jgi:hypothetical protein
LTRKTGRIGLQQNQKADVEFRDAWIKPLGEIGFVPLFNGKALTKRPYWLYASRPFRDSVVIERG